jgi:hypothetical protein
MRKCWILPPGTGSLLYSHHGHERLAIARTNTKQHSDAEVHLIILRVCCKDTPEDQDETRGKVYRASPDGQCERHADQVSDAHEHRRVSHEGGDIGKGCALCEIEVSRSQT